MKTDTYKVSVANTLNRMTSLFNNSGQIFVEKHVELLYLQVPHWIPIMLEEHYCVGSGEVQPQTSNLRCQ